jgi:hypothetical protein
LALLFALSILAAGSFVSGGITLESSGQWAMVLAGVPIYALIASSLGVFSFRYWETDARHRVRPGFYYLYMILVSLYAYGIYVEDLWPRLGLMVLTGLLALALWQKARDRLPYLLDPTATPPPRISIADGLIAALLFFVMQGLVVILAHQVGGANGGFALTLAFLIAGAVTFSSIRIVYWRARPEGMPDWLDPRPLRALASALSLGLLAASGGVAYLWLLSFFPGLIPAAEPKGLDAAAWPWLFALAVILAPLFEEFIFRGLIFKGLRRSWGRWPSILASAALFAVVHPPLSVLPVFGLGVCAALSYERTGFLLAPILVHALYNALVLGLQWAIRSY